jgi:phage gp45-like
MDTNIVKDSSIYVDPSNRSTLDRVDGLIRIGIVKGAFNDSDTGELRYLVEIQSNGKKINMNCRMMRRFGGIFNYEDYILRGYKTNDSPDPVEAFEAKAGDAVLVGQLNGQGREGVILGGLTHAARHTNLDAEEGPQYDAEFNGVHTNINADGEWTLTFRGLATNTSILNNSPVAALPAPTYDTTVGSSFMKFDKTGGWIVNDNATSDPQLIHIDKAAGTITINSGKISLSMTKSSQAVNLACVDLTINSSNTITQSTKEFSLNATTSVKINSPKVAIGTSGIELLDELTQLIDALGKVQTISPVGPCAPLSAVADWPVVEQIKSKINQIKGSL